MNRHDDIDVKIFEPNKKDNEKDDILYIVEETNRQRKNGNSSKAKALGKEIALIATEEEFFKSFLSNDDLTPTVLEQAFALMQFSSEAALNYYLPSSLLSTIAVNTLQEALIKQKNPMYESSLNGSAFSFYYLSVRKGGKDIPYDIGSAFAMLCGKEDEEPYIKVGQKLYLETLKIVETKIKSADFAIE